MCNAVISAGVDEEEDEEAVRLLTDLLAQDGVDPNAGEVSLLEKVWYLPLFKASARRRERPLNIMLDNIGIER